MRVGRECPKMGAEIVRALEQGDEVGFYLTCAAAELIQGHELGPQTRATNSGQKLGTQSRGTK